MDLSKATKIVNEYGVILERYGAMPAPISILPYSKQEIKTAIKMCMVADMLAGELTEKMWNAYEVVYVNLAFFMDISGKEANAMLKAKRKLIFEREISCEEAIKLIMSSGFKSLVEKSGTATKEMGILLEEIKKFTTSLKRL